MTGREARDRIRKEAFKIKQQREKELLKAPHIRKQNVIDGLGVAYYILFNLAADMASEAQAEEMYEGLQDQKGPDA